MSADRANIRSFICVYPRASAVHLASLLGSALGNLALLEWGAGAERAVPTKGGKNVESSDARLGAGGSRTGGAGASAHPLADLTGQGKVVLVDFWKCACLFYHFLAHTDR